MRSRFLRWLTCSGFVEVGLWSLDFGPPPVEVAIGEPETRAPRAEVEFRAVVDQNSTCRNYKKDGKRAPIAPRASILLGLKGANRGSGVGITQGDFVATPGVGLATAGVGCGAGAFFARGRSGMTV